MPPTLLNLLKGLQNTLLCKYYQLRGKYNYPLSILPKKSYRHIIDIDNLLTEGDFFLVRRSDKSVNETFNELNILREDAILVKDVPGMSLNLLGGEFKSEHIMYSPKDNGSKRWKGERVYFFIDFKKSYVILSNPVHIYFPVKKLHGKTFPYYRGKDDHTKKIISALNLKPEQNGKYKFTGSSRITHDPTNLNYWHIELELKDDNGDRIKNASSAWITSAAQEALGHFITGSAKNTIPVIEPIKTKFYLQEQVLTKSA